MKNFCTTYTNIHIDDLNDKFASFSQAVEYV